MRTKTNLKTWLVISMIFVTVLPGLVRATDPNLVGWWKFDDGSGTTADNNGSFGSSHDGTLTNLDNSDWVGGLVGSGALEFDGIDDYVSIPALNLDSNTMTISAWIKRNGEQAGSYTGIVVSRDGNSVAGLSFGGTGPPVWAINNELAYNWNDDMSAWDFHSELIISDGEWVFVAVVVEPTKATLYLGENGILFSATNLLNHDIEEFDGVTWIGSDDPTWSRHFKGRIDDVRIYNRALDISEVNAIYAVVGKAFNPNPTDGAEDVARDVTISWAPGFEAADMNGHEVYFGTDKSAVEDANTSDSTGIYRGHNDVAGPDANNRYSYNVGVIDTLVLGQTYYWRVDEVNGPNTWRGDVWTLTVETGQAKDPRPADGLFDVDKNVVLSWSPGIDAASHNLYFGTDSNEVNGATSLVGDVDGSGQVDWSDISVLAQQWLGQPPGGSQPSADWNDDGTVNIFDFTIVASNWKASGNGVFKGHHALDANCYDACGLELGKTYYWQIDEVNAPRMWPGDVWSFRVAEYPTFRAFSGVCRHTRDPLRPLYDNALGWGRQDIPWIELEPYAPNDPNYVWMQWNLDSYGDLVLAYNAKYAHLLPILDYGTDWAGGYRFIDDEHVVNWQNYVERVVDFLRKPPYNVKFFQIWNEPDYSVFWHGDMDTFMTNVHLPGADVIHNLGCKVVFGGWLGNPSGLVDLLDLHSAWDSVDVLDMHYKGIGDWQYLRDAAAARGYENIPIWETEVGGTWHSTPDLHYISNFYPRLFYWALTHNANMSADMYKVFYYREWEDGNPAGDGYHQCLYSGNDLWHLGASLQTLGDLFDGGIVSDYNAVGNNRGLTAQQSTSVSSIESFEMDDWVVTAIHLDDSDVGNPSTDTVILTYSEFQDANDVNSVERVDVSGYITDLSGSYDVNGLTVTVPVANDSGSPVQSWGLDGSVYNFYVVVTRDE